MSSFICLPLLNWSEYNNFGGKHASAALRF